MSAPSIATIPISIRAVSGLVLDLHIGSGPGSSAPWLVSFPVASSSRRSCSISPQGSLPGGHVCLFSSTGRLRLSEGSIKVPASRRYSSQSGDHSTIQLLSPTISKAFLTIPPGLVTINRP